MTANGRSLAAVPAAGNLRGERHFVHRSGAPCPSHSQVCRATRGRPSQRRSGRRSARTPLFADHRENSPDEEMLTLTPCPSLCEYAERGTSRERLSFTAAQPPATQSPACPEPAPQPYGREPRHTHGRATYLQWYNACSFFERPVPRPLPSCRGCLVSACGQNPPPTFPCLDPALTPLPGPRPGFTSTPPKPKNWTSEVKPP